MIPAKAWLMVSIVLELSRRGRSLSQSRLHSTVPVDAPKKIAIIGGGLAGLSTVFHLLEKQPDINVTVFDRTAVGTGGASSVAAG